MSNELVSTYPADQIDLIRKTVAKGATDDELKMFLIVAGSRGLDPFTRQVHFIKRRVWNNDKKTYDDFGTIQTGIDGYRTIAARTNELAGIDDAIYDSEDKSNPNKASVTVWRMCAGNRCAFTATARWNEYAQTYKDKTSGREEAGGMWKKMPYLMLAKCAEALALRKAFPSELSGIYTNEEMQQADKDELKVAQHIIAEEEPPQPILSDAQRTKIWALANEKKISADEMNDRSVKKYGVRVSSLSKSQASEVIEALGK